MSRPIKISGSRLETTIVVVDARNEPTPLIPRTATIQNGARAVLATPIEVWHHVAERDVVLLHQRRRQLSRTVIRACWALPTNFAHFNGDRVLVPRTTVVRMVTVSIQGQVLHRMRLVNSEVPAKASRLTAVQVFRVATGITCWIRRTVNRNKLWSHRP